MNEARAQALDTASTLDQWRPYIIEASERFDIPATWIERVIAVESAGQTRLNGQPITSRAGAMGLMQLMPDTYADMQRRYGLGTDPYQPHDNILAGTAYLRLQFEQYGYPGLFAAYNAGPGRYEASLKGRPLPAETRDYLQKVARNQNVRRAIPTLFVDLSGASSVGGNAPDPSLFAPLSGDKSAEN